MYFIGCPDCKRKVNQERVGFFRCDYCNKSFSDSEVRVAYNISAKFSDSSDSAFVSLLGESGD
jgi:ribosomal protein L37AE/L43A